MGDELDRPQEGGEFTKEQAVGNLAWAINLIGYQFDDGSEQMAFLDRFLDWVKGLNPEEYGTPQEDGSRRASDNILRAFSQMEPNAIVAILGDSIQQTQIFIASYELNERIDKPEVDDDFIMNCFIASVSTTLATGV